MHELSIAMSIVEMAVEEAESRGADRVDAVYLRLGPLSGVVPRALLASFDLACADTPLEGSRLVIDHVPISIRCATCGGQRSVVSMQSMECVECGTPGSDIVSGREIEITALELPA
jgi:hydrogenase nickel incorporation protein HypA/HybF